MPSKQNRIIQAIEEQQCRPPPAAMEMLWATYEMDMLQHYLTCAGDAVAELRKFVPVRVVSCIEGCLKSGTAALVNHGDPYRGNARQLFQQVRIDFDVLKALLEDRVSFGEIIAGSVAYHDLAELNSRMTALLGCKFFDALRTVEDRRAIEIDKCPKKPIIDSLDSVLCDIADALKVRHIICHEGATGAAYVSERDARRFLTAGYQFTNAASWLILETLEPNAPLTQTEMNIDAGRRATVADAELNSEVERLSAKLDDEDKQLLSASHAAWLEYRKTFSMLEANAAKGGTMHSSLYGSAYEVMTKNRTNEIRDCLRQEGLEGRPRRRRRSR